MGLETKRVALAFVAQETVNVPQALLESIRKYGVLHPVLLKEKAKGFFVVVDGRRRTACARELGLETVPAIVLPGDVCAELVGLSEHYSRSPSPAVEAEYFMALIKSGMTQQELAAALGISQPKISQRLNLREKLHPDIFQMLKEGRILATVAREITSLDEKTQRNIAKSVAKGQKLSVKYVKGLRREKTLAALDLVPVPEVAGAGKKLCPHCGKEI